MDPIIYKRVRALSTKQRRILEERLKIISNTGRMPCGRLFAAVVGHGIDIESLRSFCEDKLPPHMVPQIFVEMAEMPKTPAGKIDRQAIQRRDWSFESASSERIVKPRSPVEEQLASIWCDVLGFDEISVEDNFFEVGGDSLLTIRILSRAAKEGLRISPDSFFRNPTIAGQAALVNELFPQAEARISSGPIPLLPIQHWFFENIQTDARQWNQSFLFELSPSLTSEDIGKALQTLIDHHDALRTRFVEQSGAWSAEISEHLAAPEIREVDLAHVSKNESGESLESVASFLNAGFDLTVAPLLSVAHFIRTPDGVNKLLIVAHHLVIDMESWLIIIDDLGTILTTGSRSEQSLLPARPGQIQQWSLELTKKAEEPIVYADRGYWEDQLKVEIPQLPTDFPSITPSNTEAGYALVSVDLETKETDALFNLVQDSLRATPYVILLSSLARSIAQWTRETRIVLETEGHGRESLFGDYDVSRTVGWLTTVYPLVLEAKDLDAWRTPNSALRIVKEAVAALPNKGITFGLLRYLSSRVKRESRIRTYKGAPILFNYLGQTDQSTTETPIIKLVDTRCGPSRSTRCERAFMLEVNARFENGRLIADFSYNNRIHEAETIERIARNFVLALREIIEHSNENETQFAVASDFPLADLSADEFERLSAQIDMLDE